MRDEQVVQTIAHIRSIKTIESLRDFLKSPLSREGYCHDFKAAIPKLTEPTNEKKDIKEEKTLLYRFRSAFAALANSHGGFIIAGVDDKTLKPNGCDEERDVKKRIGELLSVLNPLPDIDILPGVPFGRPRRWIYMVEVLPSPSYRKPHFFDGRIYYRTRDLSSCHYVKSSSELSERIIFDTFHFGSIRSFKQFILSAKRAADSMPFPMVKYLQEIESYLIERRRDPKHETLVNNCVDAFNEVTSSLDARRVQYTKTAITQSEIARLLNERLDNFERLFIQILEIGLNG